MAGDGDLALLNIAIRQSEPAIHKKISMERSAAGFAGLERQTQSWGATGKSVLRKTASVLDCSTDRDG